MKGRKPVPTQLKIARNNPGLRPLNAAEPKPEPGDPIPPKWLCKAARKEWDELIPHLRAMRILASCDYGVLSKLCDAEARYQMAVDVIHKHGNSVEIFDDEGRLVKYQVRAEAAIADRLLPQIRAYYSEIGLTIASRTRIKVENGSERTDANSEYLKMEREVFGTR